MWAQTFVRSSTIHKIDFRVSSAMRLQKGNMPFEACRCGGVEVDTYWGSMGVWGVGAADEARASSQKIELYRARSARKGERRLCNWEAICSRAACLS